MRAEAVLLHAIGVVFALGVTASGPAAAESVAVVDGSSAPIDLSETLDVVADARGRLSVEDLASRAFDWGPAPVLDRGPRAVTYWARLRVRSSAVHTVDFVLIPERHWQVVDAYVPRPGGGFTRQRTGTRIPIAERPLRQAASLLPLRLGAGETATVYLRFHSDLGTYAPPRRLGARIQTRSAFLQTDRRRGQLQGIYAGVIAAMVAYNLFLFVSVRDRAYLLYVLYAGTFGAIWVSRDGLAFEWIWPGAPRWNHVSTFYLIGGAAAFGCLFAQSFLETRRHARRTHLALSSLTGVVGVALALGVAGRWVLAETLLAYASLLVCVAFVGAGVVAWSHGYGAARVYLAACGALALTVLLYTLAYLGVLGRSFLTVYGVQMGSAAEALLLAFALGDRINLLRRDKEAAEALYRRSLEREVQERTRDLAQEKARLEVARRDAEAMNQRLHSANERLARLSRLDELTGLANRRHLEAMLTVEWRRGVRTGQPLSLVLVDVDHFKEYNDEYGHLAGDRCLQAIARALAARCLRAGDFAARYGGEEFLLVLPSTDREGAVRIAEDLRKSIEELAITHAPASPLAVVTVSVGVGSARPRDTQSVAVLIADADAALYTAKRGGRNRVVEGVGRELDRT